MSGADASAVVAEFYQEVPMAKTMGLQMDVVTPTRSVVRLPDQQPYHNHLGGSHAGAIFTLGESASGVMVLAAFGDELPRVLPLALQAQVSYLRVGRGDLTATADMPHSHEEIVAEIDAGNQPHFEIPVTIQNADRQVVAEMRVVWMLRRRSSS